ncbi:MAG: DUF72 domain-containing protein, partial [Planctomycetota bacterium]
TFYAYPRADYAQRWLEELTSAPPSFAFTAKIHQDFTHRRPTAEWPSKAANYRAGLEPLRSTGRLRCLLAQFPVSFTRTADNRRHLAQLLKAFAKDEVVLELRHRSWFEPEVLERFRERGIPVAWIDLPPSKDHLPEEFEPTAPLGYLRLHGRNQEHWFKKGAGRDDRYNYLYDRNEVERLVTRTRRLAGATDETLLVTNNHFAGQAVANAIELRALLEGESLPAPQKLVELYPQLAPHTHPLPGEAPGLFDAS